MENVAQLQEKAFTLPKYCLTLLIPPCGVRLLMLSSAFGKGRGQSQHFGFW